ncbi:NfuA family Fe-S biogenesis protein [Pseudolysobacter antarcticus]|uniref:Fe/S biogenesis protein NfuA n=1 Tax=Pseudolysobacter antarcticus TaxID=2511995 RepID=A0A411HJA7_9GAMM|nr:NfuA family Fe-S biogenesis protein [Pseudolysobacter antarcticus]QBB70578.1 NfuA family Fe-S biogenesis protein [Pseudolysobacter antarcticus]
MISISETAQHHFSKLLMQQGIAGMGIRVKVTNAGLPTADCNLEFCELSDLQGDEWSIECTDFILYVDAASTCYLDNASIDYQNNSTGGQLTIKAPKIRGTPPDAEASLVERVRYLLVSEINPQIASHGGRVSLVEIDAEGVVYLQFGGGCQGCGNADVTLKQGIEKTLRERLPEITAVRDATDHAKGVNPYYQGRNGASAVI